MRHLVSDLKSRGFGGWGHRRDFVNGPVDARYPSNVCGTGWATKQWPKLVDVGTTVNVVVGSQLSCSFTNNGNGTYTAQNFWPNILAENIGAGTRTLTDTFGRQTISLKRTLSKSARYVFP